MTPPDMRTPQGRAELLRLHADASDPQDWNPDYSHRADDWFYRAAHAAVPELLREVERLENKLAKERKLREAFWKKWFEQQDKIDDIAVQVNEYRDRCDEDVAAVTAERDELKALVERLKQELNIQQMCNDK